MLLDLRLLPYEIDHSIALDSKTLLVFTRSTGGVSLTPYEQVLSRLAKLHSTEISPRVQDPCHSIVDI
jgi:hypothetical protein